MKIVNAESFLLKVPASRPFADSMRTVSFLELIGLKINTEEGITGTGYTVTVGAGGSVIQNVLDTLFISELIGKDPYNVKKIWRDLYFGKAHWIGRAGATMMAQSAVDIALWDIIAKSCNRPLWQILGGCKPEDIPIYNTDAGWLNFSEKQLIDEALELIDKGYTALKMKVGLPDPREDAKRVKSVRKAIGDDIKLMVDANQKWDAIQAHNAAQLLEEYSLTWLEEPLHPDDVRSHKILKEKTILPIALGEHIYSIQSFRDYMEQAAVDIVQVDVSRIGGITPWLEVAAMADMFNIRVCPHAGDIMQVHQHLVKAIPNSWYLEVIPWKEKIFINQIKMENGRCITPDQPGASTEIEKTIFEKYKVS
jgi:L-alanine-DL-glutamate epimerase-like enolase superfamily enzyme